MRNIKFHLLAAACALAASQARADDVSFSGFAHGSESVTFTVSAPNAPKTESVDAGGFATVVNGGPSFDAYCVDLYQTINFGAPPYTEYTPPGTSHVFANSNAYSDLSKLYATAGVVNNAVDEAAFQIAVWEIAYETTGTYDLTKGSASFSGGTADSSGALTLASTWLGELGDNGAGPGIVVRESSEHQDMISPVPEPETYALFMAGLAAVGFMARRRKS
jgi:hypothetical protein